MRSFAIKPPMYTNMKEVVLHHAGAQVKLLDGENGRFTGR